MKYFLPIIVSLHFLVSSANATDIKVGSYLNCTSSQAMRVTASTDRFYKEANQNFMIRVGRDNIEFSSSSGSYVSGMNIIKRYHQPHLVSGYSDTTSLSIERKGSTLQRKGGKFRFYFSSTHFSSIFTMFGNCDLM